jgi:hypothetical protein
LPVCPKCGKFISESHYERHLKRCGVDRPEPEAEGGSVTARLEKAEGMTVRGTPEEAPQGRNWTKLMAAFVLFLLVGSLVAFFILYGLSML